MIQDIFPHKLNNQYANKKISGNDYVLTFNKNNVNIIYKDNILDFPTYNYAKNAGQIYVDNFRYLFSIDERNFFLNDDIVYPQGDMVLRNVQEFRKLEPQWLSFAGITAYTLSKWYNGKKFCGCCGKPMLHHSVERAMVCEGCGIIEYPKISPAIIVGITSGDEILMTKYVFGEYRDYALVAGFMEIGETFEQTVAREVKEEVGLNIKNIRYFGSQPWAFSDSVLVGFFAECDGDKTVTLQADELSESIWINRKDIPPNKTSLGITQKMIDAFKNANH